ncbi:breast cancer type 2 susceptibility protein homolog isoform X2 [Bactrocera tryoni]|uniref:breast cancer type 2 susceptibility protein homolog isoform X2 n=1 Tax=Bactrocera tryoni TaxID=59916 RepID=UPI001A96B0E2|nr:breast cancer type 2 susceptibility protein homolog isoform X2 [Bactrocera tryoni]
MADESINSSPRKLNNSIHKSRLHRRHKRLNATFTTTSETSCKHEEEEGLSCTLLVMYDSDETMENSIKNKCLRNEKPISKVNTSYDPFAEHRLLVLADRSRTMPSSSRLFKATQGFEPCNNFLIESLEQREDKISENNRNKTDVFEITDSELLQVCEETEKKTIDLSSIKEVKVDINKSPSTPKRKTKSIVDLILEDFCSSPQSPELQQSSEESNFNFRFTNKPLRTYSKRKHEIVMARQNIAEQYNKPTNSVAHCVLNDDLLSNDSSTDLSVQEDQTEHIPVKEAVVVLQHSQSLCENLQNLSAYFTESSGERDKKQDPSTEFVDHQLAEDYLGIRTLEEKSSSEIYFTANKAENDSMQIEEELVLPETEEQFKSRSLISFTTNRVEDDCMQIDEELVVPETEEQSKTSSNGHISNEEDFNGFSSEEEDTKQNCDTLTPNDDTNNDEQNDEWYDECDIFAKFDMGIALDAASSFKLEKIETSEANHTIDTNGCNFAQMNAEPLIGFRTASNKEVKISAEAQARVASIFQNLPPLPINNSCDEELPIEDEAGEEEGCQNVMNRTITISKTSDNLVDTSANPNDQIGSKEMPGCGGFSTTSYKVITSSNEAKQQAARALEMLTPLPQDEICLKNDATSNDASTSKELFIGFRTASSKLINISKEAQERALKILEQLPNDGMEAELDAKKLTGFATVSRKTIQISDDAKKRAARILEDVMEFQKESVEDDVKRSLENLQFSEWPVEEEEELVNEKGTNANTANEHKTNIPGFSTAPKKQRAAVILESLPELRVIEKLKTENIKGNSETKPLDNFLFPEWPLATEIEDRMTDKPETALNGLNKRKRSDSESAQNRRTSASPPRTPKLFCKSTGGERSPLAHIQATIIHSSLSEMAVNTPPDYRARHGIIARKNLLSLNMSNKLKVKFSKHHDFKSESSMVETPTKRSGGTTAALRVNEPKSPPATPIPNLQEFFNSAAMSTSTPQPPVRQQTRMSTRARKRAELVAAALNTPTTTKDKTTITTPTNDGSFKHIDWENDSVNKSATSLNVSRLSNSSCSNIMKMESNPTPKQRIERLRMYGKPPSVSPICMSSTNNCRVSGLQRRPRSAAKGERFSRE